MNAGEYPDDYPTEHTRIGCDYSQGTFAERAFDWENNQWYHEEANSVDLCIERYNECLEKTTMEK